MREEVLDTLTWESLKRALSDPVIVEEYVEKLRRQRKQKQVLRKNGTLGREAALRQIELKELQAIEMYRSGSRTSSELAKELDEINREKKIVDSPQNQLWSVTTPAAEVRRTLGEYCRKVAQSMENASPENRQQVLRLLIVEILFEGVQVRIRGAIDMNPDSPDTLLRQSDSWKASSSVGITSPISRSVERNPTKMEFEIVAPMKQQ